MPCSLPTALSLIRISPPFVILSTLFILIVSEITVDASVICTCLTIFESFPTHERRFLVSVALPWLSLITILKCIHSHKSCHAAQARSIRFPFVHCCLVCAFHLCLLASQASSAHIRWCGIFSALCSYSSSWVVPVSTRLVFADICLEYYSPSRGIWLPS